MNVLKNMEAIFVVSAALILLTSVASAAAAPAAPATRAYVSSAVVNGVAMPVVNVVGKRRAA